MILFDTDVIIDALKGRPEARSAILTSFDEDETAISVITLTEVRRGMRSGEQANVESLLSSFEHLAVTASIAQLAGDLGRQYRRSHLLSVPDLLIAGTAQANGAQLVTNNVKHYPMIKGLKPAYK
jgi:predicted nucleic acid-binding protein